MKFGYAMLLLLGVVAALVLICLGVIRFQRDFSNSKFDERQQASRGRAYQFGWGVGWCYAVGLMLFFILQRGKEPIVEPYLLVFGGILFSLMAFDCYCLLTDSAVPPSQKPVGFIVSGVSLGILYLANGLVRGRSWTLPLTGDDSIGWIWLMAGVAFLFRGVTQLIRQTRGGKE